MILGLAVLSLLVALSALALAVAVTRQSGALATDLQRHRLGHERTTGTKDPGPASRAEARRAAVAGGQTAAPQEPAVAPQTGAMPRLPRPGEIGRPR